MRMKLDRCCAAVNLAVLALLLATVSGQAADPVKKPAEGQLAAAEPAAAAAAAAESPTVKIEAALRRKVTLDFKEKPLGEIVAGLAKSQEINMLLDEKGLEEATIDSGTPITFQVSNISMRSALSLMLAPMDCTFTIRDEVLQITTHDRANGELVTRCYPVQDLAAARNAFDEPVEDYATIISMITQIVHPTTWDEVGGPGAISIASGTLIVSQTAEVHVAIADLLQTIRTIRDAGDKNLPTSLPESGDTAVEQQRKELLSRRVSWHFEQTPLGEAMESIGKQVHYNIRLDVKALEEASVDAMTPVTFEVKDVSFGAALRLLLRGLDLHYVFKHEVLQITTLDKACQELTTRLYPVGDLLAATDDDTDLDYASLMHSLQTTVHPTSWDEAGGPGSLAPFAPARVLVISQEASILDEIDTVLESLRALRAKQAAIAQPAKMVTKVYELGVLTPRTQSQPAAAKSDPKATAPATPPAAVDGANLPAAVCPAPVAAVAEPLPILEIVGLVQEKIAPETWDGEAKVRIVGAKLLITQTPAVHRRIARLLDEVIGQNVFSLPIGGGFGGGMGGGGGGGGGFFVVPARN